MLMNKCGCIKSYCSLIKTGKKHNYMLYLVISQTSEFYHRNLITQH